MAEPTKIRRRDRDAILQSLAAGVVPRRGLQHIQVGRAEEVSALLSDIGRIVDGGSAVRFVIGEFGSGKTFFLQLIRSVALEMDLVTMHADLTPERRLYSTSGHASRLYAELARNTATRNRPEGGALPAVVERFVTSALQEATASGNDVENVIRDRTASLSELVGGYDFAAVIAAYWKGHDTGEPALTNSAVRWLRGEYATKTEARRDLGVRSIIDDANSYDHFKLLARFARIAGYSGLLVALDELVNLYKLANSQSRRSNYEQILRIVNDCLQGSVEHLGFAMGGTPEFLTDSRRGLYSYEALQSRLAENTFVSSGLKDFSGPVIRLASLSPEELYVLLTKLRDVQASYNADEYLLPNDALRAFMTHCSRRIGDAYFRTPRNTIKAFVHLMAVLDQNPTATWQGLLSDVAIDDERNPDLEPLPPDAESADGDDKADPPEGDSTADNRLTSFRL